nr:hypothetical protein [Tanacetum cinerariifolium]
MQDSTDVSSKISQKSLDRGGIGGSLYDIPLMVVMAFAFPFGFGIVLLGKEEELETFDLLSMIDKHSRGILSKKLPPAAESSAS